MRVIGYVRVSTGEQASSGLGLDAQRAAIVAEAKRRGWELAEIITDEGVSGRSMARREGLRRAFEAIEAGEAEALVVSKLDRLSRSLIDFAGTVEQAKREGWQVIALDIGVDPTTATGELMGNVMAAFAQHERRLISDRTKAALAEKKAQGFKLGRPAVLDESVRGRIVDAREAGKTWQAIADELNTEGVPTAHGGATWWPATVRKVALAA